MMQTPRKEEMREYSGTCGEEHEAKSEQTQRKLKQASTKPRPKQPGAMAQNISVYRKTERTGQRFASKTQNHTYAEPKQPRQAKSSRRQKPQEQLPQAGGKTNYKTDHKGRRPATTNRNYLQQSKHAPARERPPRCSTGLCEYWPSLSTTESVL